jgi:hypothetical protein
MDAGLSRMRLRDAKMVTCSIDTERLWFPAILP